MAAEARRADDLDAVHSTPAPRNSGWASAAPWIALLLAVAVAALASHAARPWLVDDALTSMGYARHLAAGAVLPAGSAPIFGLWSRAGAEVPLVGFLPVLARCSHLRSKSHPTSVRRAVVVGTAAQR